MTAPASTPPPNDGRPDPSASGTSTPDDAASSGRRGGRSRPSSSRGSASSRLAAGSESVRESTARWRAIEADLVAYLHGEPTEVPTSEIERAIESSPRIRQIWLELEQVSDLLGWLPEATPSAGFVRRVMRALPELEAAGHDVSALEEFVRRTRWSLEDRFAFAVEYTRYRFQHYPSSSAALVAATLLLAVTIGWLPSLLGPPRIEIEVGPPTVVELADNGGSSEWFPGSREIVRPERRTTEPVREVGEERNPIVDRLDDLAEPNGEGGLPRPVLPRMRGVLPRDPLALLGDLPGRDEDRVLPGGGALDAPQPSVELSRGEARELVAGLAALASLQDPDDGAWPPVEGVQTGDAAVARRVETTARIAVLFASGNFGSRPSGLQTLAPRWVRSSRTIESFHAVSARAISFLIQQVQRPSGRIGGEGELAAHCWAMRALAADYLISGNYRVLEPLDQAARYLQAQQREDGGFSPAHRSDPDGPTTLLATLDALEALIFYTQMPGAALDRDASLFQRAGTFVASCVWPENGLSGNRPGPSDFTDDRSTTAAAVRAQQILRMTSGAEAVDTLNWLSAYEWLTVDPERRPRWEPAFGGVGEAVNPRYWSIGSVALLAWEPGADGLPEPARAWWDDLRRTVLEDAPRDPVSEATAAPGVARLWSLPRTEPTYSTALLLLPLTGPYRSAWLR